MKNNGWISVKERLPEEDVRVLIAVKRDRHPVSVGYRSDYPDRSWYDNIEEFAVEAEDITHWMPLPPAPEGE